MIHTAMRPASVLLSTLTLMSLLVPAGLGADAPPDLGELLSEAAWGPLNAELEEEASAFRARCDDGGAPGAANGCGALGLFYSRSSARLGEASDAAVDVHRLACRDGYAWACYFLADAARQGRGSVEPDPELPVGGGDAVAPGRRAGGRPA